MNTRSACSPAMSFSISLACTASPQRSRWSPSSQTSPRTVEIWNSLTGVVPVKKFMSRSYTINRIWKQIQYLAPTPAPRVEKKAKRPKATLAATSAPTARDDSKKAEVLDLLRRPSGATLQEIMITTGWQAHTVRGFISGTLTKGMGLAVESLRGEDKVRPYRVASKRAAHRDCVSHAAGFS